MPGPTDQIILKGLKQNNLKNIDVTIQKEKLTVLTGLSGSGKSSVAFDTLATESRRQMMLNFPQHIRYQMPRYERPNADLMQNLSPVVVVEQRPAGGNSRSTVGTYMDIDPLIRLLFSRIGDPPIGSATDFSSQSSFGSCPECGGFGKVISPDAHKLIDRDKSLREYAIQFKPLSPAGWQGRWIMNGGLFDPDLPIKNYPEETYNLLVYGPPEGEKAYSTFHTKNGPHENEWDGLFPRFRRLYINRDISKLKDVSLDGVLAVSTHVTCPSCQGSGLNPDVLTCKINGLNIAEFNQLELAEANEALNNIHDPLGEAIAQQAIPRIKELLDMGLGYLSLTRKMNTLSGGEAQRVKIARHLGSSLNNMTYIFDEPSAGLHPDETDMLITMLQGLKQQHNTVVVIEHDQQIIETADEIIEMGSGAGTAGGEIVYQGTPEGLDASQAITTLNHTLHMNKHPRDISTSVTINHANHHNLKDITVDIPENMLVTVCGVSGSGKSSLMLESFTEQQSDAIKVTSARIGISSRSTLATYMGIMDDIRSIFAKATGQPAGLFSFNSTGACPACKGKGVTTPDVAFADPVSITCEACGGTRYNDKALSYRYQGKNIIELLKLTTQEALNYFEKPSIVQKVRTLHEVGLGYMTLGQPTSTLSGGEIQRLKLASYLKREGQTYILDEPSSGLHQNDNEKLLNVFRRIIAKGNSVIIIEHRLDFLAASDWLIELGPEGGKNGGHILFEGTPEAMLQANTPTAKWLKRTAGPAIQQ